MTTHSVRQAVPSLQLPPQATQPPLQPGAGIGQEYGSSESRESLWANLPTDMRRLPQWAVAWSDKRPRTPDGRAASVTDSTTWTTFDKAAEAARRVGGHVGFMLSAADPFTCIDLDVKPGTPPDHFTRFEGIIGQADSYTERSRSGLGWHIWMRADVGAGRRRDGVEIYSRERFIICTGDVVHDRPLAERQQFAANMASQMRSEEAVVVDMRTDEPGDDMDICVAAIAIDDGGEMGRLMRGDWEGRSYPSQSEADFALMKMLARLTESNGACRGAFRLSGLGQREKAQNGDNYLNRTLRSVRAQLAADARNVETGHRMAEHLLTPTRLQKDGLFRLLSDRDLDEFPPYRWWVKGIVPQSGIGVLFGQSGTYKSFLVFDMLAAIATGVEWFGRKTISTPTVYVPFEGQGGLPKRVMAWRLARAAQQNPTALAILEPPEDVSTNMRFITDPINLREPTHRDKLVETLTTNGWAGGILCIDTLAQAGPGIDENTSQGMGEMVAIFQELQRRLGGTILVVHHSGKFEKAGMRGWSGLRGALDFAVRCWRDDQWDARDAQFVIDKSKDGADQISFDFTTQVIVVGTDEDGDPITSLIVKPREGPAMAPDEAVLAAEDDAFVDSWIRREAVAGKHPTGRSLDGQRAMMKKDRLLSQAQLRDALARLKADGRLADTPGGPGGSKWLRPVDTTAAPS